MSRTIRRGRVHGGLVKWDEIAGRLREVRGNTSQVEFGKSLGILQNIVSRYERGRVRAPMEYLVAVAKYGNVTLEWLVLGERPRRKR
jgi:transcriptional regulator with XRE-family HTH domain